MKKNLGTMDRAARAIGAAGFLTCAFTAPLAAEVRLPVFGVMGGYLLFSAFASRCIAYRLMGRSTCPAESR